MECRDILINSIKEQMDVNEAAMNLRIKVIILVIGVNNVCRPTVGNLQVN